MTPYETTRVKLLSMVKDFHTTYYPTTEVNYPKKFITDVEKAVNPFVKVEISVNSDMMGLNPRADLEVKGQLMLTMLARANCGEKLFTTYCDLLYTYFGFKTINGINFYGVNPYPREGVPGFEGVTAYIRFDTDYFNV